MNNNLTGGSESRNSLKNDDGNLAKQIFGNRVLVFLNANANIRFRELEKYCKQFTPTCKVYRCNNNEHVFVKFKTKAESGHAYLQFKNNPFHLNVVIYIGKQKRTFDGQNTGYVNEPKSCDSSSVVSTKVEPSDVPSITIASCSVCKQTCNTACQRCNTIYCKNECQRIDWSKHRIICGKPEGVVNNYYSIRDEQKIKVNCVSNNSNASEDLYISKNENMTSMGHSKHLLMAKKFADLNVTDTKAPMNTSENRLTRADFTKYNTPRSGELVIISSITKSNLIFVRSKNEEAMTVFSDLLLKLQNTQADLKPLTKSIKEGIIVVAKLNNQFHRAMILCARFLYEIRILYVDIGTTDYKDISELYESPYWITEQPRLATPVFLKNVIGCRLTESLQTFMNSHLNDINMTIKYNATDLVQTQSIYEVELFDSNGQNFNSSLTKLIKSTIPRKEFYLGDIVKQNLPTGNNVELIVLDNSKLSAGYINCTARKYYREIAKFQNIIQKYGEMTARDDFIPKSGELCIVKYFEDDLWYRGCFLENGDNGVPKIEFIDYGNISFVSLDNIRPYPQHFTFPIYTAECKIEGLPEANDGRLVERLQTLIPGESFIFCQNVFGVDNEYLINVPNVIKTLKKEKLLNN